MSVTSIRPVCFIFVVLWAALNAPDANAQGSYSLVDRTFDYRDVGRHCIPMGCRSFDFPGRIQMTRTGKALFYFPNSQGGFYPKGFALQVNRTIRLGRGEATPRNLRMGELMALRRDANFEIANYLANLGIRDGTATVRLTGDSLSVTMDILFQGPVTNGSAIIGSGSAQWQIQYDYNIDMRTATLIGGTGNIQIKFDLQIDGSQPSSVVYTSTSAFTPLR